MLVCCGLPRGYPGLILEGGKMKKKIKGASKIPYFAQKYKFFSEIDLFFQKNLSARGGSCPPLGTYLRPADARHQSDRWQKSR